MGKLDEKVAIVTGGGSGIGRAIAVKYAIEGANVIIFDINEEGIKETEKLNEKITGFAGDLTKSEDIKKVIDMVNSKFNGQLDILVNNAGWCPVQLFKDITLADYDRAFNLDVRALVDMSIQSLPLILKSKGNIINLSTVGATHRAPNLSMYTGAKAAVENFTRCWALELAPDGVRVNAIAPGAIDTNIWNVTELSEEDSKKHREAIESTIPCGHFGKPEDIANAALYLASSDGNYVNGAVIAVDGGQGAV